MPDWECAGGHPNSTRAKFCVDCGLERPGRRPVEPHARGSPIERRYQTHCGLHRVSLEVTGFCPVAQAWWFPQFACPECSGPLWDNGYCETCTPLRHVFPGDYFEQRWDAEAGRTYGHYVRLHAGPRAVPDADEVEGYLAELKAIGRRIGRPLPARQPGDEVEADVVPF